MRSLMIGLLVLSACAGAAADTTPPTGRWLTASGNLEVVVAPCGAALCGTVARVVANHSMAAPGTEMAAPAATVGLAILTDFTPAGGDAWEGHIYNRENGKTYRCVMRLRDADQLEVRPYIAIHLIGQTQIWRRVPDPGAAG